MKLDFIVIAQSDRDSALGILRVALGDLLLGHNQHAPGFRETDSSTQPGYTASHNDEICLRRNRWHEKFRW